MRTPLTITITSFLTNSTQSLYRPITFQDTDIQRRGWSHLHWQRPAAVQTYPQLSPEQILVIGWCQREGAEAWGWILWNCSSGQETDSMWRYWPIRPQDCIDQSKHRTVLTNQSIGQYWPIRPQDCIDQSEHRTVLTNQSIGLYWPIRA